MEYKLLGNSGLRIPVLSLGTATFGGSNEFFARWGTTGVEEATRLVDISLENGLNFFDTANVYSSGTSEEILGKAIKGKRQDIILATKGGFTIGPGINNRGASRQHLIAQVRESLKRLQTEYIDVYFIHGFDGSTPLEETLSTFDYLIKQGMIRYIGCSNFAAWQLMKSLSISERNHFEKFVVYQGYYSLIGRDYEQELLPLLKDQNLGLIVWSPLGWGRLTGKIRKGKPLGPGRIQSGGAEGGPKVSEIMLDKVVDELENISNEVGKTIPQVAINWLLQRQTVCNVTLGARTESQLLENLGSVGWSLSNNHIERLDAASSVDVIYPHWVGER